MKKRQLYIYMILSTLLFTLAIFLYAFDHTVVFSQVEYIIFFIAYFINLFVLIYLYVNKDDEVSDKVFMFVDWIRFVSMSLMLLLIPFMYFISFPTVEQNSMLETLHPDDKVLVYHYNFEIERGDVVVAFVDDNLIVKRVAAVPGDLVTFEEDDQNGDYRIYINGKLYDYQWDENVEVSHRIFSISNDLDENGYVKDNEYILLGDNQNVSFDSWGFGTVNNEDIYGLVVYKIWPFGGIS